MKAALVFALRRLRRGWRSGELLILGSAVAICVGAVAAIGLFTDRVRQAITAQSSETLGADLVYTGRNAFAEAFRTAIEAAGAQVQETVTLPTVVHHEEASTLAAVKAVAPGYPLRGNLQIAGEPYAAARTATGIPERGTVWVDARLWSELRLQAGAALQVGAATLRVAALLEYEPGRGSLFLDMAPRVLMHAGDLPATQLVQAGSRVQYSLLVAGDPEALERVQALPIPAGARLVTLQESRADIRSALDRAGAFLDLAILAATLLAAAAVAFCARHHGERLRDEVAVLKCLGARRHFIAFGLIASLLGLTVCAALLGAGLGYLAQAVVAALTAELLATPLPPPALAPLLPALAFGLLLVFGFALPPILRAREAPPLRVFQRDWGRPGWSPLATLLAVAVLVLLLWQRTGDARLATLVLLGTAACGLALAAAAGLLILALRPLRGRAGAAWRFGLANVMRRRGSSVAQVVALGLAFLCLLLLSISRNDLLEAWRGALPPDTPNQFLVNIQQAQVEPLQAFLQERGLQASWFAPMVRGRLTAINGRPVSADAFDDPQTQRWINREFNLSWTDTLAEDNRLIEGEWWGEEGVGQPWLSAEDYAIERLKLKLGDRLTLQIADREIELTVRNFRQVRWDSFRPNFFLLVPPGVLEDAPAIWLTSFYLPPEQRPVLRELTAAFPNVTVLDLDAVMQQVRRVMDRIVRAVEFIFLFALAAGILVLLAAIESTRNERRREVGLLRALGASRGVVLQGVLVEYAVLGVLAGLVAAAAAQTLTSALAQQVFNIPYGLRPTLWLTAAAGGGLLTALCGWIALRTTLSTAPRLVLSAG